jgi:hypothetical protein
MSEFAFDPVTPTTYVKGRIDRLRDSSLQALHAGKLLVFMQAYSREIKPEYLGQSFACIRPNEHSDDPLRIAFSYGDKDRIKQVVDRFPTIGIFKDGLMQSNSPSELSMHGVPLFEGFFRELDDDDHMKLRLSDIFDGVSR